jgi:hypothetical protein
MDFTSVTYIDGLPNFFCDEETICLYGLMLWDAFKRSPFANGGKAYVSEDFEHFL